MKYRNPFLISMSLIVLISGVALAADERDWHVTQSTLSDAPLHDPEIMYNAGGVDGAVAVIGVPSMRTYRHIPVGVDLHEPTFSAPTNEGMKSWYGPYSKGPDGKYLYVNDKGAGTIGIINLQMGMMDRLISMPFPFGIHHITLGPNGKTLYATGELTGKMAKVDIATGKTQVIDWGPAPSAPDYLDINKLAGKPDRHQYVFSNNYYHSTVGVFEMNPFKLIKEIPVGKNPHGTDADPLGRYIQVADKLSATLSIIDVEKLAVKKVIPAGAGPLHNIFDINGKYAYTSCFVADSIVKNDLDKLEIVDEFPVHYRIGHISISPSNKYVFALNKFSTGLFSPTGIIWPVNHEMIDIDEQSKTYGKTLKIVPVDGEPHNAKVLFASAIKNWNQGEAEKNTSTLYVGAGQTGRIEPAHHKGGKSYYLPMDTGKPGVTTTKDGVKEVRVRLFSYGYIPRSIRVNKGDKVRILATNIDKAAGITKNPDVIMGFNINGAYGLRTMLTAPRGVTAVGEFVADYAGEYEIYCQHFCGPLHLEMRGAFFVDDPKKGPSNLAVGDYDEYQKNNVAAEEGEITRAQRVDNLDQI